MQEQDWNNIHNGYLFPLWMPESVAPSRNSIFFFVFVFCLFRATPTAYGGSQARGPIGATAASLHHSPSNDRSKPCLIHHSSQHHQILKPLSEAREWSHNLTGPSWICFRCATPGTPHLDVFSALFPLVVKAGVLRMFGRPWERVF